MTDPHASHVSPADQANDRARQNRILRRLALSLLGGGTALCAGGALIAGLHGKYLLAGLLVGLAVFWLIPFFQWLYMARFVPRGTADPTGTTLRPDRRFDILAAVLLVVGAVVWGSWAVLGYLGVLLVGVPEEIRRVYLSISAATAVVCAVFVWLTIKRRGGGYLQLSPRGFVFAQGLWAQKGEWSDVTEVSDVSPVRSYGRGPFKLTFAHAYALCPITMAMANGRTPSVKQAGWYATDGDALRELVRFYWRHPEYRVELTDDRGLRRLQEARFELG
ncbi:hypothetical protein [Mycobacterium sp. MFM001]|uniref:hypothetical protein n=1 Tax=Mycobacterium sp. MFM001 TaxID=2049453 RepID=UPI00115B4174|nr:hypothetical protein [Mycobacterium sp. MFM001]